MRIRHLFVLAALAVPSALQDLTAPSALDPGPSGWREATYRLPPTVDPAVLGDRMTEIWAEVTAPASRAGKSPLIVILHGNHGTCGYGQNPRVDDSCEYTDSGTCPAGKVVTPNHEGYRYLARHLSSWGFTVVSINANRGINCGRGVPGDSGLNLARGRLILRHLGLLAQWSQGLNQPPPGIGPIAAGIDWQRIGLIGHSRGGEGARAAWHFIRNPGAYAGKRFAPFQVRAIFEIGAVDGQTSVRLDAPGLVWNQLLPMCDGDVSDLQGRQPYDRMMQLRTEVPTAQKSLYSVWGANHNFFNTEWQESDSDGCLNHAAIFPPTMGSPGQQLVARNAVTAFFRAVLSGDTADRRFDLNLNPLASLPEEVRKTTRVEREFTVSPSEQVVAVFEGFDRDTGFNTSGEPNRAEGVQVAHKLTGRYLRGADVDWTAAGGFFESNWTPAGSGKDVSAAKVLELRVAKRGTPSNEPLDFSVELVDASGAASARVAISKYVGIVGPGHSQRIHQTARIPLGDFTGANLRAIRSVRFVFDRTPAGSISLAHLQFSRQLGQGIDSRAGIRLTALPDAGRVRIVRSAGPRAIVTVSSLDNRFLGSRIAALSGDWTELWFETRRRFPVRDELPVLRIGSRTIPLSHHPEGNLHKIAFTLPTREWRQLHAGTAMAIEYGISAPNLRYSVGSFNPSITLRR